MKYIYFIFLLFACATKEEEIIKDYSICQVEQRTDLIPNEDGSITAGIWTRVTYYKSRFAKNGMDFYNKWRKCPFKLRDSIAAVEFAKARRICDSVNNQLKTIK